MSGIGVETRFRENLSTFVSDQAAKEDTKTSIRPVQPAEPIHSAFFDLKTKQLILNDDGMMSGDAKPPSRLDQHSPEKSPEEMLREFNEKLQLNAARRERFLENIVLKSRRIIEKVQKVRDRMTKRQTEMCQNTINTLHSKRQAAEIMRERLLEHKMERIRKRLEHVTEVREKKSRNSENSNEFQSARNTIFSESTDVDLAPQVDTSQRSQSPQPDDGQV